MISNPKIANSQDVFVMASDKTAAKEIHNLNDPVARATMRNRNQLIKDAQGEQISFTKFQDVRQDIAMEAHQAAIKKAKG